MVSDEFKLQQKTVIKDWLDYFTELRRFRSGNRLFKRVGPLLFGIELWPMYRKEYRICFYMKSLMHDFKDGGIFTYDFKYDKGRYKGMQLELYYCNHKDKYLEACEMVERQSMISLWGEVTLRDILPKFLDEIKRSYYNCSWDCYTLIQLSYFLDDESERQYYLQEALKEIDDIKQNKLILLNKGYTETEVTILEGGLTKIETKNKKFNVTPEMLQHFSGLDEDSWNAHLHSLSREKIMETVEKNVERFKVGNWKDYMKS